MSLAIQWGYDQVNPLSSGFIYFDAVTSYKKNFSGNVSKQPVDKRSPISDHFSLENPVINISACVSGADIAIKGKNVFDSKGNAPLGRRGDFRSVEVQSSNRNIMNFIPNVVGQFFQPQRPSVKLFTPSGEDDTKMIALQAPDTIYEISNMLESLFKDGAMQFITLYEYWDGVLKESPIEYLVMTSFSPSEDAESGEGLFFDITLEKISFVNTETTTIDKDTARKFAPEIEKKASSVDINSKVDSTVRNTNDKNQDNAASAVLADKVNDTKDLVIGAIKQIKSWGEEWIM